MSYFLADTKELFACITLKVTGFIKWNVAHIENAQPCLIQPKNEKQMFQGYREGNTGGSQIIS